MEPTWRAAETKVRTFVCVWCMMGPFPCLHERLDVSFHNRLLGAATAPLQPLSCRMLLRPAGAHRSTVRGMLRCSHHPRLPTRTA